MKKYSYDTECYVLAMHFFPNAPADKLEEAAQEVQDCIEDLWTAQERFDWSDDGTAVINESAPVSKEAWDRMLSYGDAVAHQSVFTPIHEQWWKARGGHDKCTVCSAPPTGESL